MKLSLRFVLPLLVVLFLIALSVTPIIETLTFRWFTRDLDLRGNSISNAVSDPLVRRLTKGEKSTILPLLIKITLDDRLMAAGICSPEGVLDYKTELFPKEIKCIDPTFEIKQSSVIQLKGGNVHVTKDL